MLPENMAYLDSTGVLQYDDDLGLREKLRTIPIVDQQELFHRVRSSIFENLLAKASKSWQPYAIANASAPTSR